MQLSEDILFWAFRYALGRMTYAVGDVANEIIRHASEISPQTRGLMTKEIREALGSNRAGMSMDVTEWNKVLARLNELDAN